MSSDNPIQFTLMAYSDDKELQYVEAMVRMLDLCADNLDRPTMERVLRYLNARYFSE